MKKSEIITASTKIKSEIIKIDEQLSNKDQFIGAVRQFLKFDDVTPDILKTLIEKIEVYHAEGSGKCRTQMIIIHYRFIGVLDIPREFHNDNIVMEPRAGVREREAEVPLLGECHAVTRGLPAPARTGKSRADKTIFILSPYATITFSVERCSSLASAYICQDCCVFQTQKKTSHF